MVTLNGKPHWARETQNQTIQVEIVTRERWEALKSLMDENHHTDTWMRHAVQDHLLHTAEVNTASRILHDHGNGEEALLLIAYWMKRPAGYLLAECIGTWRQPHVVSFHMFVNGELRGKHVGTALLQEFLLWCHHHPRILKIELCVMEKNLGARALYKNHGFVEEGNRIATALKDGELHNLVEMGMVLDKKIDYRILQPSEVNYA